MYVQVSNGVNKVNSAKDLLEVFKKIGFDYDKETFKCMRFYKGFSMNKFLATKLGICWDYLGFEKLVFDRLGVNYKSYYMQININNKFACCHTFNVKYDNNKTQLIDFGMNYAEILEYEDINELFYETFRQIVAWSITFCDTSFNIIINPTDILSYTIEEIPKFYYNGIEDFECKYNNTIIPIINRRYQ